MRMSRWLYAGVAAVGLTTGAAFSARAVEAEAAIFNDQCYRLTTETPGTCSTCKTESCRSGTYCCQILTLPSAD